MRSIYVRRKPETRLPLEERRLLVTVGDGLYNVGGGADIRRRIFVELCSKICLRHLHERSKLLDTDAKNTSSVDL